MVVKGITRRWCLNSLGLILAILVILECVFAFIVHGVFYSGVQQAILGRANSLLNVFPGYIEEHSERFEEKTRAYVEDFPDKNLMELVAFDSKGGVIVTSAGFDVLKSATNKGYYTLDFGEGEKWLGRLSSGEKVMCITKVMKDTDGNYVGAIRYVASLESVDRAIYWSIAMSLVIGLFVLVFVIMSSAYFIRSIVHPIREVGKTARKIALGDFSAKLHKSYDDEIGELCDTINYLACRLLESEKMKNDFISSVSHELRTPLTAIKGWAETIQMSEERDVEMNQKGLEIIVHESERLCGIVEELLDFSRMQSGRMVLALDKIDLLAEISEAVYMFKDRAVNENKRLLYMEPELLSPVLGDKHRLKQVFINVIDNALKYTPEDGTINVQVTESEGFIKIIVSDNGCGIPLIHLPRVKEKFYKANTTQKGSGIGLAVANEIVLLHLGLLDIKSEEDFGTMVTISIPIAKASPAEV